MIDHLMLACAEGTGPSLVPALLDPFTPAAELLRTPPDDLPRAVARRLTAPDLEARARGLVDGARALGLGLHVPGAPGFPPRLSGAPLRPNALFSRGDPAIAPHGPAIAVVGSRTPTAYGEAAARDFCGALARAGVVIWSGLAYGIDALAHEAALAARVPTVAVLAGGLDAIDPPRHAELASRIVAGGGLLLTEAPPGLRPSRGHFPRRNRILARGVDAVLVVEAGLKSGSLHTARFAAEVGVPVFAVPGPYTSSRSRGCHELLAGGAQLAIEPSELLRELGVQVALDSTATARALAADADLQAIVRQLEGGPRPADLVRRESGLDDVRFLDALLRGLEGGALFRLPGDLLAIGS